MAQLEAVSERIRAVLDARHAAREEALGLSREIIRTCANTIRAAHREELDRAREMLRGAREAVTQMQGRLRQHPEIYAAGYVHDCQKEYAEAACVLQVFAGGGIPDPDETGVEYPAYLNGLGEAVGEMRRRCLDRMRQGRLKESEALLSQMDEIYHLLVTLDYPDALTGGLRRTTDSTRGIIEKTRGELTTALRQEDLRSTIQEALRRLGPSERGESEAGS